MRSLEEIEAKLSIVKFTLENINKNRGDNLASLYLLEQETQLSIDSCLEIDFRNKHAKFLNSAFSKNKKIERSLELILKPIT